MVFFDGGRGQMSGGKCQATDHTRGGLSGQCSGAPSRRRRRSGGNPAVADGRASLRPPLRRPALYLTANWFRSPARARGARAFSRAAPPVHI